MVTKNERYVLVPMVRGAGKERLIAEGSIIHLKKKVPKGTDS